MKNLTSAVVIGLALAIAYGVAKVIILNHQAAKPAPHIAQAAPRPSQAPVEEPPPVLEPLVRSPAEPAAPPEEKPMSAQKPAPGRLLPQPVPPDPALAREALSYVGIDPDAEEYWIGCINDPSLSANERQNLIEDLNEDGLSDPRHPTLNDLPVIMNRLWLIEEIADDAMDQVNADAFQEAYKDLVNMYEALTSEPWDSW
jgi:hypothetical protein